MATADTRPAARVRSNGDRDVGVSARFYVRLGDDLVEPVESVADPAGTGLTSRGGEPVWAGHAYHAAMDAAGLGGFDAVMQSHWGERLRALAERENWRLPLTVENRSRRVYLKKHRVRTWRSRLRAWLGLPPKTSAGRDEARNIGLLEAAGIPSLRLAAYGERLRADGSLESFLMTPELEGHTQLDHFLRTRFADADGQRCGRRDAALRRLIDELAAVTRQFHEAGFNHRDLYCCHFFVREHDCGRFEIRLIDLQRVQRRTRFRHRWLVKDLAQLAYSAPRDRVRCTQKMVFIKRYLGVEKLRPEHKRLIREVLAKQQAMERKLGLIA